MGPPFSEVKRAYQKTRNERIHEENLLEDYALRDASWYVADTLGTFAGFMQGDDGLYSWKSLEVPKVNIDSKTRLRKVKVRNLVAMSAKIKSAGRFYGADLVGITKLNEFWVYSYNKVDWAKLSCKASETIQIRRYDGDRNGL